jgi:hypothetical protein
MIILIFNLSFIQSFPIQYNMPTEGTIISSHKQPSQNEVDCKGSGCFLDKKCYPYGYIINNEYCADEAIIYYPNGNPRLTRTDIFIGQKEIEEYCKNNFECITNLCIEGICKNQTEDINRKIEEEVSKFIKNDLEKINNYSLDKTELQSEIFDETKISFVDRNETEIPINKNILKQLFGWFRDFYK